jgi:hypothetical protein
MKSTLSSKAMKKGESTMSVTSKTE